MDAVFYLTMGMLALAALLTMARLVRGAGVLDRIVALDVLVTLIVAGIATGIAITEKAATVPLLLVLTLLAFVGSVTAAHLVEEREDMW